MGWAKSSAADTKSWTSAVVADNENAGDIADNPKQKMIWETVQIHTANFALTNRKGLRPLSSLVHVIPQLSIKFVGKLESRDLLVILHDLVDIRVDLWMKD